MPVLFLRIFRRRCRKWKNSGQSCNFMSELRKIHTEEVSIGAGFDKRQQIIFIYAVFLLLIVMKADLLLSLYLIGMALLIYIAYEIIRVVHMRSFLKSDEYYSAIAFSLNRLSDKKYAEMITEIQGIDSSSVYFYELYSSKQ